MNRCYAKAVEIAKELRKNNSLTVLDPHEAQTTYSTYFLILPASVTLYRDEKNNRSMVEWNGLPMDQRKSLEVRVSDHKKGASLDFTAGVKVENAVSRIMKHWAKA